MSYIDKDNNRIVVYTANTNNYEVLRNPDYIDLNIKYVCFTDQPVWLSLINDTVWEIRKIPDSLLDPTRRARQVKILPHIFLKDFHCEYSVWVDGNISIIGDVVKIIEQYKDAKFLCFKHPLRDCVYEEMAACLVLNKDNQEIMSTQIARYRQEGLPEHYGLIESNVLIRKTFDPEVIDLMNFWWQEVNENSKRDQLSFSYAKWKNNFHSQTMGNDNARGESQVFRMRPTWLRKPTQPKWKIIWVKYIGWRLRKFFSKLIIPFNK